MSRSSVCRCVLAVLAALLALPATVLGASHRGGTFVGLATANAGTADPQVNATSQYWDLYQVTQDGLTAFRKTTGPAANSVVADLATRLPRTPDGGRTWTLTLRRGVRYSNGAPVRPSDVRFTFERLFKVHGPTAESIYGAIDGSAQCLQNPATCTLEHGVALSGRTITFHLTTPDTQWLQKLALPPAALLPPSVGATEIGTDVSRLAGTGPYYWASYAPARQLVLRRNPHFKVWAPAAQPDGYVDRIVQRFGLGAEAEVTEVERGQADWVVDDLPRDRIPELLRRYAPQLHANQLPADWYVALNVNIKPFNQLKARQAANLAIDRNEIVKLYGGPQLATPTCQVVPPGFPGYAPYCPWTLGGVAPWSAPDLVRAEQLVAESGTAGTRVDIVVANDAVQKAIGKYIQVVLFKLGYDPRVKALPDGVQSAFVQNSRNRVEAGLAQWKAAYPAPSDLLSGLLGCDSFVPDSDTSPNISGFCDRRTVEPLMQRAGGLDFTHPRAAERLWRQVDRSVTDLAVWLPLFNPKRLDLVSKRVGNYRWSPQLHLMPSRLWVK
ncbi:MAG: peptide/nickel transport system substrate-binding protein [Gaiellales bacterium]|nr:peptide/nickel transport system substrate-binding protein [Gaiellales bacterium]MDX6600705.1 peptide/nickel transport system substrate-binding protein [Gaiellales bacterium]